MVVFIIVIHYNIKDREAFAACVNILIWDIQIIIRSCLFWTWLAGTASEYVKMRGIRSKRYVLSVPRDSLSLVWSLCRRFEKSFQVGAFCPYFSGLVFVSGKASEDDTSLQTTFRAAVFGRGEKSKAWQTGLQQLVIQSLRGDGAFMNFVNLVIG